LIAVTGGAGFIGSAIIWGLNARGITDIIISDHLGSSDKWKNLRGLKFCDYMEKDAFLYKTINSTLPKVDAIFHLGACSDTTETDCSYLIKNNYEYTKELALYAVNNNIRFIYASSAATYGDGSKGFLDDESGLEHLEPLNMYGYSKHLFDLWAKSKGFFDKITGIKYFNVFGPNEYHKGNMRSFIIKGYQQIKQTGNLGLFKSYRFDYGDGEQKRDFVYIKDAVDMTLFFLDKPEATGIFNVGNGEARSWNELDYAIFSALEKSPAIEYVDMPENLKDKYQYFTEADISKIRKAGFNRNTTSMEDAAADYIQSYLLHNRHLGSVLT